MSVQPPGEPEKDSPTLNYQPQVGPRNDRPLLVVFGFLLAIGAGMAVGPLGLIVVLAFIFLMSGAGNVGPVVIVLVFGLVELAAIAGSVAIARRQKQKAIMVVLITLSLISVCGTLLLVGICSGFRF